MKEKFAYGMCFKKMFLIFTVFSVFGSYYEQILNLIKHLLFKGTFFWQVRRGVIYGPFSPIYGVGAVIIILLLGRKKRAWWQTIIYGALIGGLFEYTVSFLQELIIGTTSWNYSKQILNIGGRTTVLIMLAWGILSFLVVQYFYPLLSKIIESFPKKEGNIFTNIIIILLSFDMLISWTALFRQTLRRNSIKPFTPIGKLYDEIYPDEKLKHYFPNMKVGK